MPARGPNDRFDPPDRRSPEPVRSAVPRRAPVWMVPVAVLLALVGLTLALWRAESSLEAHSLDRIVFVHRASSWVLWGGLVVSLLVAALVLVTLSHRAHDHHQTRRHVQALESLQRISSGILSRVEVGATALVDLCESARHLIGMDRAGIQLLDAKAARLELLAHCGDMPANPPRYYNLADLPNVRLCLEKRQVLCVDDIDNTSYAQNREMLAYFKVRSMVLIPLLIQGEQIGLMTLSSSKPRTFDSVDRQLAELLGSQAAVILANSRLHEAQQAAVQKYKALVDQRELLFSTNAAIFQTGNIEESLHRVAELAPLALGVDVCVVELGADPPDNVRIAAVTPGINNWTMRVGTTFFCPATERAYQRGVICVFANAAEDPDLKLLREGFPEMGSVACVPLSGRDGARMGALALIRRRPGAFSAEQLKMARLFSTRAAAAIENARLHQETRRALEEQKRLLIQRDVLWSVNAAVYRAGTLEKSLNRIVRLAPAALGVDLCAVDLVGEREGEVVLAAMTNDLGREMIGKPFNVKGLNAGRTLERREPMVVDDARTDPGVPRIFREMFQIGSIAYFPLLRTDGVPLGLLILVRHKPGSFDPAGLETAHVFSTRAASAIENAQLLDQTRRDAATKAMLLRELNHRVKNNLAGIVALLSMGQPEMPSSARRWLDRVTDRVRVMAGAHQLFVGDAESVPLATLVERMLSSLAVARPIGAAVCVDFGADQHVELRTEQAISLAMVLHELCYNAIVHGLGEAPGTVTLRTRPAGEGRLAIDVVDTGRGIPDNADTSGGNGTGIGLELVRGLVGRELRGTFSLGPASAGGTIATVEFPLLRLNPETDVT